MNLFLAGLSNIYKEAERRLIHIRLKILWYSDTQDIPWYEAACISCQFDNSNTISLLF